jgi:hypothetical protein
MWPCGLWSLAFVTSGGDSSEPSRGVHVGEGRVARPLHLLCCGDGHGFALTLHLGSIWRLWHVSFYVQGSEGSALIIHGVSSLFFFWSNLSISFSLGVLSSGSQQISEGWLLLLRGWLLLQKMTSKYC